jgi:ubiquinone/menaquinone biosynthesis C-methylase UbiE
MAENPPFPPNAFDKWDTDDDAVFYQQPRLVTHIDDAAIAALTEFYRVTLPTGGKLLDVMSSWVSHLPADATYAEVIGLGMNEVELSANPRLTRWLVQNLNVETRVPLDTGAIDAAMICVSIQYLQQPVAVLAEIRRVLVPGGQIIISFSNRCFPTKAVAIWQSLDIANHARLVALYLQRAGFKAVETHVLVDGHASDPLIAVVGRT